MNVIKSFDDFQELLNCDRAILFLKFEWSGYTKMMQPYIYHWIKNSELIKSRNIPVFEFYPEGESEVFYMEWLTNYEKKIEKKAITQVRYHGYGDIVWFEKGEIKGGASLWPELPNRYMKGTPEQKKEFDKLSYSDKQRNGEEFSIQFLDEKTKELIKG